ncbi:hypothetical protein [Desulfovibrio oxyclinae]|jgi:hypothetical protein|uniref:hypothetical protein n=1 Tax=Desulfovibrio oxyclinae TaxID=63560 RepID=UPI00037A7895|nr:hypothetical protein [Desulfovibrio oxyclinae]
MKRNIAIMAGAVLCVSLLSAGACASGLGDELSSTCSSCHSTKRICRFQGVKDAEAWKETVERMIGNGAELSEGRVDEVAAYLNGLAPGTGPFCE